MRLPPSIFRGAAGRGEVNTVVAEVPVVLWRKRFYLFVRALRLRLSAVSPTANQLAAGGLMTFDNQSVAVFSFEIQFPPEVRRYRTIDGACP